MKSKRVLSVLMAALLTVSSLAACGGGSDTSSTTSVDSSVSSEVESDTDADVEDTDVEDEGETSDAWLEEPADYQEVSEQLYDEQYGDFYSIYAEAKEVTNDNNYRWALMATAEAKLLETGTMIPTTNSGSRPQISRIGYSTINNVKFGGDGDRYHSALVATEPIKTADWDAMKEKYQELKGTGTYLEWAKTYMEEQGYTLKDELKLSYGSEPESFDTLSSSRSTVGSVMVNCYEGLMEYDAEGVQQPAMAESYTVSDDGLVYTFKIRQGVQWVDSQGRELGEVTADDWVAGAQHMCDTKGGLSTLVKGVIKGLAEYDDGEDMDFSHVGVKAIDDYTLEYTLEAPTPYFMSMLGYSCFAPLNRSYYESLGGTFGDDYADNGSGDFGLDPNSIAYNGPYVITNRTESSTIVYSYNESYWNPDGVNVHTITWNYNDGSDVTKYYTDLKEGTTDSNNLVAANRATAEQDGWWEQYGHITAAASTSYMAFENINRVAFANARDAGEAVSPQSEEEQERTSAAMKNANFRMAIATGLDRVSWNAQAQGDDFAPYNLINSYVPSEFVALTEETTVSINGVDTTFPAGTDYVQIMQAQLDADDAGITVWNEETKDSTGFDGWYSVETCQKYLNAAIEELAAEGVEVSAENPIQVDLPYDSSSETYTNKAQAFKQSVEASTNGCIQLNLVKCADSDAWMYTGYYTDYGWEANYDLFDLSGWGPDYGDPCTYLDTFLPYGDGYMLKTVGLW